MNIFAITLTWNGLEHIIALKSSLNILTKNIKSDINFYWYVRDNSSNDQTELFFKNNNENWIKYFKFDHNRDNYAQGNNWLYEQVKKHPDFDPKHDLILFLNNDIVFDDGEKSLHEMLKLYKPNVGIIGARLFYPSKKIQHAGVTFSLSRNGLPFHLKRNKNNDVGTSSNKEFQAVTFACALVSPTCINNMPNGKINEKYVWCFDDVNSCLDVCKNQKKRVLYCGKTFITHNESVSLKKNPINSFFFRQNCDLFKKDWSGKYEFDEEYYIKNINFRNI